MLQKYEIFLRFTNILTQKSRLSPDSQLQKTNYLKTNLLKQIKKISFTKECLTLSCEQRILSHVAKVKQNAELCKLFSNKKIVYAQKYQKKGMNTIIHPLICYIWFAKLYHQGLFRKHYSLFTFHYSLLHHSSHTWGTTHRHSRFLLGLVNNQALCCQEHTSDRSSVLQSHNQSHQPHADPHRHQYGH